MLQDTRHVSDLVESAPKLQSLSLLVHLTREPKDRLKPLLKLRQLDSLSLTVLLDHPVDPGFPRYLSVVKGLLRSLTVQFRGGRDELQKEAENGDAVLALAAGMPQLTRLEIQGTLFSTAGVQLLAAGMCVLSSSARLRFRS